jgi:hypothetical protein
MFAVLDEPAVSISTTATSIIVRAYCTHTQLSTVDTLRFMVSIRHKAFRDLLLMDKGDRLAKTMELATPMLQRAMEKKLAICPLDCQLNETDMSTEDSSQQAKRARTASDRWCPSSFATPPSKEAS